jgi:L-asparaginase II
VKPILVEVVRGDVVEALHRVHAVAVSDGKIVARAGVPELETFFRSSAKPIQALPLVRSMPRLGDAEIAIACAALAPSGPARARAHLARGRRCDGGRPGVRP